MLDLVQSNISGPVEINLVCGARSLVTLYDDSSAVSAVRFFKERTEPQERLKKRLRRWSTF